jgi:hypothetical protein
MTKEEFLEGIKDGAFAMQDPNSEFGRIIDEGRELEVELREFDPILADKVGLVCLAIQELGEYIKLRAEV